ncbi:DNA ligase D [Mucilaginibacter sp. RS28]|uniref:DNA ligase (ATP) n=1 Tax=Mucilaginibacter straminoryzae TaxID=2932774 RepID=A0A9X2B8Y1_9SPHI|nr:DNA ligase D [Mucilaginibacter straminoryzae]MCJ8210059.1 DNA ligase D [Mucilaginibacter straminoryzae]
MAARKNKASADIDNLLKEAPEAVFPAGLKPMLATLVDQPFDDPDWVYEVKWDGYRALCFVNGGQVEIQSRNSKSFNEKFYPIYQALQKWPDDMMVDGEIIVVNNKGISDFSGLQGWRSEADGELIYYVFDLLYYKGHELTSLTYLERRELLETVLPKGDDRIRLSQVFKAGGKEFFAAADKLGLEGIIAKKANSFYQPDVRSKDWLKIKTQKRQEAVIGGYTHNEGSPKKFNALLMGVFHGEEFQYIGPVGTGFSDKLQKEIVEKLQPLVTDECPFPVVPDFNKPSRFRPNPPKATVTWVRPEMVGEVAFRQMTPDNIMRHASFQGLREDKNAREVTLEMPGHTDNLVDEEHPFAKEKMLEAPKAKTRKTLLNPKEQSQMRNINGHDLKFNNLNKLYWPEDGVTKRDMLNYYYQIAPYILPYLKDRPQSLNRFPNGIHGMHFYQKNVKDKAPDWIKTFPYTTSDGEHKEFLVATDEYSLLYMASLGAIEMNPWFSRVDSPDNPDYCVIDLDPDQNTFEQVIQAALEVKKVLDAIGVPSYCKTSGSTGMHIYIPLAAKYTYDQSQLFGRLLVNIVHKQIPDFTSVERMIANRHGKMYLDFLQNRPGATLACPYSLRPKPGATVSMPVHWDEVKPGLKMSRFNIHNAVDRVRDEGDLFNGVLGKGIDLEITLAKAKSIFEK